jgi:hypothetical protein
MNGENMPDGAHSSIYELNEQFPAFDIKASTNLAGLLHVSSAVYEEVQALEAAWDACEDSKPMDTEGMDRLEAENESNPVGNAYIKFRKFIIAVFSIFKLGEYAADIVEEPMLNDYKRGLEMLKNEELAEIFRLGDKAREMIEVTKKDLNID